MQGITPDDVDEVVRRLTEHDDDIVLRTDFVSFPRNFCQSVWSSDDVGNMISKFGFRVVNGFTDADGRRWLPDKS